MTADRSNAVAVAVETSGRVGSVAVGHGACVLAEASFPTCHQHGVELLPTVDRLCRQAAVTPEAVREVYVSGGPGSFTGLRIGITFAKAMALAVGARIVRVPTLEAIAQNARALDPPPARVVVLIDAKRGNVYCATFALAADAYVPCDPPAERDPFVYLPQLGPVAALGEGCAFHTDAVAAAPNVTLLPAELSQARAAVVHQLGVALADRGAFTPAAALIPIYIRRPEAEEKWEQRQRSSPQNPVDHRRPCEASD